MTETAGRLFSFYTRSEARKFGPADASAFTTALARLDSVTSCHPLTHPQELQLNPSGLTLRGNARYTVGGFRQIAGRLAQGAVRLFPDLSGTVRSRDDRERFVDGNLARRLWNDLVGLRFPLVERNRLVRNDTAGAATVDGLIGLRQPYQENAGFYEMAMDALTDRIPTLGFHAAVLLGRRMAVWVRDQEPVLSITARTGHWPVYRGFYFGNGETSGTAARITNALFTPVGLCLLPYRRWGKKVRHAGDKFVARFTNHLQTAAAAELDLAGLRTAFTRLFERNLGFRASASESEHRRQVRRVSHALLMLGVPHQLATAAIADALEIGYTPTERQIYHRDRVYSNRCCADLFVSLLRIAKKLDLDRRECLEQAAFEVLTGRFLSEGG